MEHIVQTLNPSADFEYCGLIDFTIDSVKVEVKSCQEKTTDASLKSKIRNGRFCFRAEQHKALVEQQGDYILIVQKAGTPFIYIRVPAKKLKLGSWNGEKHLSWKTAIKGALA